MKKNNLLNMTKGWFIGDFEPSLLKTPDFEVGVKYYKCGDTEKEHTHKISTEFTIIIKGKVLMNNIEFNEGDIIIIEPGEYTDFICLEDTITTVVKTPSSKNDKHIR